MNYIPKSSPYLFILASNILMIYGVWKEHWSPFLVCFAFWVEAVLLAIFTSANILFAKGGDEVPPHYSKSGVFLVKNLGILFLFAIALLGFFFFPDSDKGAREQNIASLSFRNEFFNFVLLGYLFSNVFSFIFDYWLGGKRTLLTPDYFSSKFNRHLLATFFYIFYGLNVLLFLTLNFSESNSKYYSSIVFLLLVLFIKTMVDTITYAKRNKIETSRGINLKKKKERR